MKAAVVLQVAAEQQKLRKVRIAAGLAAMRKLKLAQAVAAWRARAR